MSDRGVTHSARLRRPGRVADPEAQGASAARQGRPGRVDEDQGCDVLGMMQRVAQGDQPAHRVAAHHDPVEPQVAAHRLDRLGHAGAGVAALRVGAGEAMALQVEGHDPVVRSKRVDPGLPGVERGVRAVEQHQRGGAAGPFVAQVDGEAGGHLHEARGGPGVAGPQHLGRDVGGPGSHQQTGQRAQPQGEPAQHPPHRCRRVTGSPSRGRGMGTMAKSAS